MPSVDSSASDAVPIRNDRFPDGFRVEAPRRIGAEHHRFSTQHFQILTEFPGADTGDMALGTLLTLATSKND